MKSRTKTTSRFSSPRDWWPEMIAGSYEFELPPIPCTIRLRDVLERMTDAELALQPGGSPTGA